MDVPSWLESAIQEEVGDYKIKPVITFKRKQNELFVGYVWKIDDVTNAKCTHNVSNEILRQNTPSGEYVSSYFDKQQAKYQQRCFSTEVDIWRSCLSKYEDTYSS